MGHRGRTPVRHTSNMEIVKCCQSLFGCELPSVLLTKRYDKFIGTLTNLS